MPVSRRWSSLASTWCSGTGRDGPPAAKPRPAGLAGSLRTSSCSVFHLRQAGHWPSHFGEEWPHSAQAKTVRTLAAARAMPGW